MTISKLGSMTEQELFTEFGKMNSTHLDSSHLDRELARRASCATIAAARSAKWAAWATFTAAVIAAISMVWDNFL